MTADELKRRKMEARGLRDEADLIAFDAIADILHRQWLYESVAPGCGDRKMAVRHLGDVIRGVMSAARPAATRKIASIKHWRLSNGSLDSMKAGSGVDFVRWSPGQETIILEGDFSAAELRALADHMEKHNNILGGASKGGGDER